MPAIPFERFRHKILELYPEGKYEKSSIRAVLQVLREFDELRTAGGRRVVATSADLDEDAINAWLKAYPDRSPARAESLLRTLQPMIKYGVKKKLIPRDSNPFETRSARRWAWPGSKQMPRKSPKRSRSESQIAALLALLEREAAGREWKACRRWALASFYAYTGCRKCEALQMPASCVDLDHRAFRIAPRDDWSPKTVQSARTIPLADPLVEVLRVWLPMSGGIWLFPGVRLKRPWLNGGSGTRPLDEIKAAAKRAGIGDDFTILGFRKSVATLTASWGISDENRRLTMGHTAVETAREWYEEPVVEELRPALNRISYGSAPLLQIA